MASSNLAVVLGLQWGDEGKGKIIDYMAQNFDVCARCQVRIKVNYLI
jgi:adenylosuccinate synthase